MPMGRKQKETVELRFYEIPQGEPVLALLGEEWNRVYGHDNFYLHFHNLMEIGICRKGEGELIINEHTYTYRTNSVTLIPPNIPHTTISNGMVRNSWEFLYVDVNHVMEELYGDRIAQKNEAWDDPVGGGYENYKYYLSESLWADHIAETAKDLAEDGKYDWEHYYLTGADYAR